MTKQIHAKQHTYFELTLGGITKKIQATIKKVQKPIDKAINKGVKAIAGKVKGWFGKSKGGKKKVNDKDLKENKTKGEPLNIKPVKFSMEGAGHTMTMNSDDEILMASRKGRLITKINQTIKFVNKNPVDARVSGKKDEIISGLNDLKSRATRIRNASKSARKNKKKESTKRINRVFASFTQVVAAFGNKYDFKELGAVDKLTKEYSTSRPSYAKGQRTTVWNAAVEKSKAEGDGGRVYNPYDPRIELFNGSKKNWDMGHIGGQKYKDKHKLYMKGKMTKEAFLKWYQTPSHYEPEEIGLNRSRKND